MYATNIFLRQPTRLWKDDFSKEFQQIRTLFCKKACVFFQTACVFRGTLAFFKLSALPSLDSVCSN